LNRVVVSLVHLPEHLRAAGLEEPPDQHRREQEMGRARATAAYEQDDDASSSPVAVASDRRESSGMSRVIFALETLAWTTAESRKPRIRAHSISRAIPNARERASSRACSTSVIRGSYGISRTVSYQVRPDGRAFRCGCSSGSRRSFPGSSGNTRKAREHPAPVLS
jgi:hypothetical protein